MLSDLHVLQLGQEYDTEDASADPAERIRQQRRQLHKRLGLDGQMKTLLDTEDLVKDEDLVSVGGRGGTGPVQQPATRQAAELLGDMKGRSVPGNMSSWLLSKVL